MALLPENIPDVDLSSFLSTRDKNFQELLKQREMILFEFERRKIEIEKERHDLLQENYAKYGSLGLEEDKWPLPPLSPSEVEKFKNGFPRTLSDQEIKRGLIYFMREGEEYSSNQLTDELLISYRSFTAFTDRNPDFLIPVGRNKWKRWKMNPSFQR